MTDLSTRIEQAGEGCRELDQDIWLAIDPNAWRRRTPHPWLIRYTTSLDAAMTLVPEDAAFTLGRPHPDGLAWAHVYPDPDGEPVQGRAATLALALAAAAIRARGL